MIASVIQNKNLQYPSKEGFFSPDEAFPEYAFKHLSAEPNNVYRMMRECLAQAGLDRENFGKPSWNPLRYIIPEGSKVFVLCNFVYHRRNKETEKDFFAKCTHGSAIRAAIDYILLAAGKDGSVSFGNAPLQSCNWQKVIEETGSTKVLEFYRQYTDHKVTLNDLRLYIAQRSNIGTVSSIQLRENTEIGVEIDLGRDSFLEPLYASGQAPKFRVTDYNPRRTEAYHAKGKHIYVINKKCLDSDIIVSIPKLKTHEKVGITCGLKGYVGAIGHKDCLAHHRFGTPGTGGDEYPDELFFLNWISILHDNVNKRGLGVYNNLLRMIDKTVRKLTLKAGYAQAGGWYGNGTAWRMTLDIAKILNHATSKGKMNEQFVRKHIMFTDGVIGGEGNGPLSPMPVKSNFLSYCDDVIIGDNINCLVMGFDPDKIALIREAFSSMKYPLTHQRPDNLQVIFNNDSIPIKALLDYFEEKFIPPRYWKGHIEL